MTDVAAPAPLPDAGASASPAPTSGRRAVGDIVAQVVGRVANGLLGVAVMVLLTRTLGTDDFGRWSTLLTIVSLAGPLTELGITQVAVSRAAEEPEQEDAWLGALLAVRLVLAVVATAICLAAVMAVGDSARMRAAGMLLTGTILLAAFGSLSAVFQLRVRNDLTVLVMSANSAVWTAGVVVVSLSGGRLVALAAVFLLAAGVSAVLQTVIALRRSSVTFTGWSARSRSLLRVGLPLSISSLLMLAYARVDQVLVFELSGRRAAGLYGAAYRILDQAMVVPLSVTTTLYPLLVRAHRQDPAKVRWVLQRALEVLVAVALGALAFAIPCGGDALALLFGEPYRTAGPTLAVLMGVFVLISVNFLNGSLVLMLGLQKRGLVFAAAGLVVNLGLNLALIPRYGFVAAAWATLVTEAVVVALTTRVTLRALGWAPDLRVPARGLLAAILTAEVLSLARLHLGIVVLLALTPLVYGALLAVLGGERTAEAVEHLRRRRTAG